MIKIFFLIRSLEVISGAERQLLELVRGLDKSRYEITVATFYDNNNPELDMISGVDFISLGKKGRWDILMFLSRLFTAVRRSGAQIVHGYLDVGNIFSLFVGKFLRRRIVFGVRASNIDFSRYDWTAGFTFYLAAFLSYFADRVIANSYSGAEYYQRYRLASKNKVLVIPNGIDTEMFQPGAERQRAVRRAWKVADDQLLVGLVARLDPMKDHPAFLSAAAKVSTAKPGVKFVCVGAGPAPYVNEIKQLSLELGLENQIFWAGQCTDMPSIYNSMDVLVLPSSSGEGFPNVVAEAMSCGVPCVVTDVGDSAAIVGDTGLVVPPRNPQALADALISLLERPLPERVDLGRRARRRIVTRFSTRNLIQATGKVFDDLAGLA